MDGLRVGDLGSICTLLEHGRYAGDC
jgi:hypothetical protein